MGQVYLTRSPGGRLVAVKVIRPEFAAEPGFRARFAREVAAARTVSGIYTAPVVDADPEGPQPWLATAYVPGPSLAAAVAERGPLPVGVVLSLGAGLAEGLQAIHAAGLVHRDLKPANVLLADDGPRVIDFGISRAVDASMLTQTGTIMGSPGFLSPEQAEGREVGPPGDVFCLGAVLTFAVRGEGPFGTGTAASLVYRVVNAAPDLSGVPEQLRPLIEQCLAKDPASRPTTSELLTSFETRHQAREWLPLSQVAGPLDGPAAGLAAAAGASGSDDHHPPTQTSIPLSVPRPASGVTQPGRADNGQTPVSAYSGPAGPTEPVPERTARRGRGGLAALIVGGAVVLAAASAGITLALSSHPAASGGAPAATHRASAPATASPTLAATSPAPVKSPQPTVPATPTVVGVWTGTYTCNQGLTGMRLTITSSGGDTLRATFDFYAVASNPGVPNGSWVMTGNYSASGGLILIPDYWIDQPFGYTMIGLSGPSPSGNSIHGTIQGGQDCTTFSATR
jgi:serine/threonine protein kinase